MKRVAAGILTAGFVLTCSAWAQEEDPGRGVARISVINGDVSVRRGDSGDFVAAAINAPLVVQDHLVTGDNSRAEAQLDWANMLRLSANTEVRFAELEARRFQIQLSSGTVTHRVLRDSDAEVEINTPSVSVRPVKKGSFRVAVLPNGDSEITVRSGEVEIYSPRGVERLRSGRTMIARGSANDPEFQVTNAIPYDDWDRWNEARDHDLGRSRSYQYVSRDIYGADDLDRYGRWVYAPPYGYVWSPAGVGYDWAPYRAGRWVWVDYYGWTWVSYEPWGWAPYHYGRWFHSGPYGWCWFPGPIHHRNYWAPGLVAFFGWGSGVHVGVGFGSFGWVPLAPYETYHRWYGRGFYGGRNSFNNVHIVNNVNITNVYRNARAGNGITGLRGDEFVRGGAGRGMRASDIPMQRASLMHGSIPATPGRESLRLTNREVTRVPRTSGNDHFFSRRQPAAVERVPFEEQRRGMDRMVRGSFGDHAGVSQPARAAEASSRGNASTADRSPGWRRMGDDPAGGRTFGGGQTGNFGGASRQVERRSAPEVSPRETGQGSRPSEARPSDTGNWRRFGGGGREAMPADGNRQGAPRGDTRSYSPPARSEVPRSYSPPARSEAPRSYEPPARSEAGRSYSPPARSEAPRSYAPPARNEAPRSYAPPARSESPRSYSPPARSEQIHINPPIVRERSAPRYESSGGGGNRGGGGGGGREYRGGGGGGRGESRGGGRR